MPHIQFPMCPEPENIGEIWRYLDIYQLISILDQEELYFSRVDQFDDDYEGALPEPRIEELRNDLKGEESKHGRDIFEERIRTNRILPIRRYANCWHINESDSQLMWDSYGGKGVAIESSYDSLSKALGSINWNSLSPDFREYLGEPSDKDTHISIFEVEYKDFENDYFADGTWGGETLRFKRKKYAEEKELRASFGIKPLQNGDLLEDGAVSDLELEEYLQIARDCFDRGVRVGIDVEELITAIHVSPNAPSYAFQAVESLVSESSVPTGCIVTHEDSAPDYFD